MDPEEDSAEQGRVLAPEELDVAEKDGVAEIDEGRFVVSSDGTDPDVETQLSVDQSERSASAVEASEVARSEPSVDRSAIRNWHEHQLTESPCSYGYHLSLKAGRTVDHHTIHSDDVTMTFNNLLLWYARTVDADLPPGAVLGILLSDASVPVQYPVRAMEQFLMAHGLSTDDSIADLLDAVREGESVEFPPRSE